MHCDTLIFVDFPRYLPSIVSVADFRVVVEENANRPVGELEAQPVFVGVIDPFGDKEWHDILYSRWITRVIPLHLWHARFQCAMHLHALRYEAGLLVIWAEYATKSLPESRQFG